MKTNVQNRLINWDFKNTGLNSSTQLINRQKSALHLSVITLNQSEKSGIFNDKKNGIVKTSLENCECKDFNFVGNSPRKNFIPCMHIYRLAFELGIMQLKYIDHKTKRAQMSTEERKKAEVKRLHKLEKDTSKWGNWNEGIHKSADQRSRQYNAYYLFHSIKNSKHLLEKSQCGIIHDYTVTFSSCTCPDFSERKLPCKHIYCFALLNNIKLPLTEKNLKN